MIAGLYRGLTSVAAPALAGWLRLRLRQGKEDAERIGERRGIAGRQRPAGPLVWLHAASVGEAMSVLPLVTEIRRQWPSVTVLFTSGTMTSAQLLAERLPPGCLHQFMPLDVPAWIDRFLDHWQPGAVLWVESELWPNAIAAIRRRGIPLALINARMSPRSFARWQSVASLVKPPLDAFNPCLAQDETSAARLKALGAGNVQSLGNLKFDAAPLAADDAELARLRDTMGGRALWLAASLHPGEVDAVATAHRTLATTHPGLLTLVVPRHPARGGDIAGLFRSAGLTVIQRSQGALPDATTDVYVADTLGELGLFYRLVSIAFIGGSLVPHGGQNPLEAARLGCAIVTGPHMHNFAEAAKALSGADAIEQIDGGSSLAAAIDRLFRDPAKAKARAQSAQQMAAQGHGTVSRVVQALAPLFENLYVGAHRARA